MLIVAWLHMGQHVKLNGRVRLHRLLLQGTRLHARHQATLLTLLSLGAKDDCGKRVAERKVQHSEASWAACIIGLHTCSWEEVTILVERHSHDTVCGVEGFLHAVTVMYINVNVQHPEQQEHPID